MPRLRSTLCTLLVICSCVGQPAAGASTAQDRAAVPEQLTGPQHDALHDALMRADAAAVQRIVSEEPARLREPVLERSGAASYRFPPPLHLAASRNFMGVARALLDSGADPNGRDQLGNTPLHGAMMPEMVRLLVAAGADAGATNTDGETPLETMYWWRGPFGDDLARALIDAGGELSLDTAVKLAWTDEVERILAEHPDQRPGAQALYRALRIGNVGIVDLLIAAGVDVDASEPMPVRMRNYLPWDSAAVAAIHSGHPEVAIRLLEAGAGIDSPKVVLRARGWSLIGGMSNPDDGENGDLLDRVIDQGCAEIIPLLVQQGLDPSRPGSRAPDGWSLRGNRDSRLVRAAWRGHADVIEALLEYDVDIDERSLGVTALLAAAAGRHLGLYDLLLERGARLSIHAAAALGRADDVQSLLQTFPGRVDLRDERCSWTPLAWAVHSGSIETVEVVLAAGADINESIGVVSARPTHWDAHAGSMMPVDGPMGSIRRIGGPRSTTALSVAVQRELFDIARRLVEAGARADLTAGLELCRHPSPEATEVLARSLRNTRGRHPVELWAATGIAAMIRADVPADERFARFELLKRASGNGILVDDDGQSILSRVRWGPSDDRIARRLLDAGAPLDLVAAAALGWVDEIRAVQETRPITRKERAAMLGSAGGTDRVDVVLYLLDTAPGGEPLDVHEFAMELAWAGHARVIAAMVERGVLSLERDSPELLALAAGASHSDLLVWLLANGVDVHAADDTWPPALHSACGRGRVENARILLAAGAGIDHRDRRGNTALLAHLDSPSTEEPSPEVIGLLLDAGADPLAFGRRRPHAVALAARDVRSNVTRRALRDAFSGHVPARYLSIFGDP